MKAILCGALALTLFAGGAFARDRYDHAGYGHHHMHMPMLRHHHRHYR